MICGLIALEDIAADPSIQTAHLVLEAVILGG